MLTVILVNNSKKDADKYVHADNDKNDKEQAGPIPTNAEMMNIKLLHTKHMSEY